MPFFKVLSSEVQTYSGTVEADSPEQARQMFEDGEVDLEPDETGEVVVDSVEEVNDIHRPKAKP